MGITMQQTSASSVRLNGLVEPLDICVERIGPDEAKKLIDGQGVNRRVSQTTVRRYARDIKEGRWEFTGDTIKVNKNGVLLDGQHRLLAVIMANMPITTLVVRGVRVEIFDVMDIGKMRNGSDVLSIVGASFPSQTSQAISALIRWKRMGSVTLEIGGTMNGDRIDGKQAADGKRYAVASAKVITPREVRRFYETHRSEIEASTAFGVAYTKELRGLIRIPFVIALHFGYSRERPAEFAKFVDHFAMGTHGGMENNPATLVRARIVLDNQKMRAMRQFTGTARERMFIWALNKFCKGEGAKNISMPRYVAPAVTPWWSVWDSK